MRTRSTTTSEEARIAPDLEERVSGALSAFVVTEGMQDMLERKQQCVELLMTLYSSEASASSQEEVAARLGPSFLPSMCRT